MRLHPDNVIDVALRATTPQASVSFVAPHMSTCITSFLHHPFRCNGNLKDRGKIFNSH